MLSKIHYRATISYMSFTYIFERYNHNTNFALTQFYIQHTDSWADFRNWLFLGYIFFLFSKFNYSTTFLRKISSKNVIFQICLTISIKNIQFLIIGIIIMIRIIQIAINIEQYWNYKNIITFWNSNKKE